MYFKINQQTDAQCDFLITEPKDSIVLVPNFITANSREFFEPNFLNRQSGTSQRVINVTL